MDQRESLRTSGTLMILSLIDKRDMYGYEIIETLNEASEQVFSLKEGTLYPLLHRLEQQGFLKSYQKTVDNKKRKYYKITKKGVTQLAEEKASWKVYSKAISNVVGFAS
ncbi:MAG: PadR family transcriptional regulator [Erysipelothrix sp.]|nr:PadR family transcriptional regulator [Erysipelothrix sp.]